MGNEKNELAFYNLPPLSLYVHIPWCEKKCPYCDFNSHALTDEPPERQYLDALLADLDQELPGVWGRRVHSIFIGGGTPSLMSPEFFQSLLSGIRARLSCLPDIEITLEANPGSSEVDKFKAFKDTGINRLSIGVQSFNSRLLRAIGRVHDGEAALQAAAAAPTAGFENFNLDLMYGLPNQDQKLAVQDLRTALSFDPPHLSYYQLTIEPNTFFCKYPPQLPDEDECWQMQLKAEATLGDGEYRHYEISAYAKEKNVCKHNLNYWRFGDYLGIGAGAHSKISMSDRVIRTWKLKNPSEYLSKAHGKERIGGRKSVPAEEIRFEFMLNALRLTEPIPIPLFQQHTGQSIASVKTQLEKAQEDDLLEFDGKSIATTHRGQRFLNELLQRFLPN
ncbi:MAG: radical SAM family heme chaperone HemW [Arenicellales bacterium]|nr:radical SAM family heme chaperone HemW [Arenicellales bacterium]